MKKTSYIILALLLILGALGLVNNSWASCSGSGLTWSCTAGSTSSQINSAISSASDGAAVTLDNGSYNWSSKINISKNGLSLLCASYGGCNVTASGQMIDIAPANTATGLIRISGFNWSYASAPAPVIWVEPASNASITKLRIDHNSVTMPSGIIMFIGYAGTPYFNGRVYGVIDHNAFSGTQDPDGIMMMGGDPNNLTIGLQGSANNLFVEDNTFTYATQQTSAGRSIGDIQGTISAVWRHNTITNTRLSIHGICHGGPANFEVYNNTFSSTDGYRQIHLQGSLEAIIFNNIQSTNSGGQIALLFYRDETGSSTCPGANIPFCDGSQSIDENRLPFGTYHGYRCWGQPGSDINKNLKPVYLWNNIYGSGSSWSEAHLSVETGGNFSAYHFLANRDYYEAVSINAQTSPTSPFNGTNGVGFGTLANRPTTCATNSLESGGGVGYFAIDQGTQGTLYRCSDANTWTVQYQPYTYPHPLTQSGNMLYGDISSDGTISAYDASLAAQYAVSLITLTPAQITAADVSGDGTVSAYDASLIAQKAVGLITKFPVEGG